MNIILAYNIKKQRMKKNMTQQQVANALAIHRSTYTYYESGKIEPNIKMLLKLAKLFDVDIKDLLKDIETENISIPETNDDPINCGNIEYENIAKTKAERTMLHMMRHMTPKQRKSLMKHTETIVNNETV